MKRQADKMAQTVDIEEFRSVLASENTVLADFYSDTCVPCRRMTPVLAELESEHQSQMKTVKVDVALNGELAEEYGVYAVPTFVLFRNGREAARLVGAVPKERLEHIIIDNI